MTTHRSMGMIGTGFAPSPLNSVNCGGRPRLHICKYEGKGTEENGDKIELMILRKNQKVIPHMSYIAGDLADDSIKASIDNLTGQVALNSLALAASGATGVEGSNNGITYDADAAGVNGNEFFVELVDPEANSAALAVTVRGQRITVSLATGEAGAITSTAAQVIAAVNAAAAGVTASNTGDSTGAAVVAAASVNLSGGIDSGAGSLAGAALNLDEDINTEEKTLTATVTGAIPVGKTVVFGIVYTQL